MPTIEILPQPTDETCGATSLHAIYQYYGMHISLEQIVATLEKSVSGGTLAPLLGVHALQHGFSATIYTNNLDLFDPSWFTLEAAPPSSFLIKKLHDQRPNLEQRAAGLSQNSDAYVSFLQQGGHVRFQVLTRALLKTFLYHEHRPIITGLSSTYLYKSKRERFTDAGESISDDIRGQPCGHFVVLSEYHPNRRTITVADPYKKNPISHTNYYEIPIQRVLNAILLGVFTYDAVLLIIQPNPFQMGM